MAEIAGETGSRRLFVRQSSGLVRDVSLTNALFFNIAASFTSVMPRSGGDYVFTSRITSSFLGWLESWTLVIASVLIIAFEVPLVLRNLQITARIIGIGPGGHFFDNANTWFTDSSGAITGAPGFIASIVVLLVIAAVCVLPTRSFHRVVTTLAGFGVACFFAMFVFGLLAT